MRENTLTVFATQSELIKARRTWIADTFGEGATRGDIPVGDTLQPAAVSSNGLLLVGKGESAMIVDPAQQGL